MILSACGLLKEGKRKLREQISSWGRADKMGKGGQKVHTSTHETRDVTYNTVTS